MTNKPSYEELEYALRESEKLYRSVVDNIGIGIAVISPQMEILSLNKQLRDWSPEIDISSKPLCYEAFNNPQRQEICTYCPTITTLNDEIPQEAITKTPLGDSFINYRIISTPIKNEEGIVVAAVEVVEDVTERMQTEEELRKSNNTLQSIFRAAPIGIGLVVDRVLIKANDRLCDISGYERQELINQSARMLYLTEEEFRWVGEEKYRQISEQGAGTVETQWRRKDGKTIDILLSSTPLDLSDLTAGVTFTALDITSRKKTEEKIIRAKKEWETTFDAIDEVVTVHDKEMRIIRANKAAALQFNTDPARLIGKHCYDIFRCASVPCEGCPEILALKHLKTCRAEINHYSLGKIFEVSASPIKNGEGQLVGCVSIAKDITKRRKMEEKLNHAQKMEAISKLSASIAHEINNPLAGIQSVIEGIKINIDLDEQNQELIDMAILECGRIKGLIQDLQNFNKPSSGVKELVDIHSLLDNTTLMLETPYKNSHITIKKQYASELSLVQIVSDQIKQVVLNLLTNAKEAITGDSGTVTLITENRGSMIAIHVHDTGKGIKPENLPHIFDPFFTTKSEIKGCGLGLPVSYGIVKGHGGDILIDSDTGTGTTISIILPLTEDTIKKTEHSAG